MTAEERDREALSAVMDGEAQELELRRTLDAVAGDASLRDRWQRHHRVRDALHGQFANDTQSTYRGESLKRWRRESR